MEAPGPGRPDRQRPLPRRHGAELIAEELRRLERDDVYREAVQGRSRAGIVRATVSVT